MTTTLVVPEWISTQLSAAASDPLETAGVLLTTRVDLPNGSVRLLARDLRMVPDADYMARSGDHLAIRSTGWVPALAAAENMGATPMWFHTHPGLSGIPLPSEADQKVDLELSDLFRLRSGARDYGTIIISPRASGLAFSGSLKPETGAPRRIDRLLQVGDTWRLTHAVDTETLSIDPIFDRNVRAFGSAIQKTLSNLAVGIVGCGGTGSAVAEQLVRLGVRDLRLLDGDVLSASNLTRVYGSKIRDVGRHKPEILCEHLQQIAADLHCEPIVGRITEEHFARSFTDRDIIFGCTDDNAGRLILSRLAAYFMIPVVDVGVLLSSDAAGVLTDINCRVTTLIPGSACLVCRDRIDLQRAAVELQSPDARRRLEDEGYAPALGQVEPAVVAYTTLAAATAVNELLERFIGFGPRPRPSEILVRVHERETSGNRAEPKHEHYCDRSSGAVGKGDSSPFLGQVWVAE